MATTETERDNIIDLEFSADELTALRDVLMDARRRPIDSVTARALDKAESLFTALSA